MPIGVVFQNKGLNYPKKKKKNSEECFTCVTEKLENIPIQNSLATSQSLGCEAITSLWDGAFTRDKD